MFQPKMLPKMKVPDSNSGVFHLTPSKQNHCYLLIRYDLGESRFLRPRFVVREFSPLHFFLIHPQPPFPSPLEGRDAGSCYLNYLIDVLPKLVIVTTYYLWAVSHLFSLLLWHSYLMQTYLEDLFISSEILLKDSSAFELSRSPLNSWYWYIHPIHFHFLCQRSDPNLCEWPITLPSHFGKCLRPSDNVAIQKKFFLTGGVYDSPEDYFHTVQNLWNAMTFGEGNAALSPKCKWRSNDGKECGMVSSTNVLFGD